MKMNKLTRQYKANRKKAYDNVASKGFTFAYISARH